MSNLRAYVLSSKRTSVQICKSNLWCIRCFDMQNQRVYASFLKWTCVQICKWWFKHYNYSRLQSYPDNHIYRLHMRQLFRYMIKIKIIHFKPWDPDTSLDLILHQMLRFILGSDQAQHHKLITCILDLTLHQIFDTCTHGLMIFSSFYSFSPFSITWTKTS